MKTYISRIIRVALFLLGLAVIYCALDYLLVNDTNARSRVTIHDFYETEDIETLFIGTSHGIVSIDAVALTERTGQSTYNLSTNGQCPQTTYYLLKEALRTHKSIKRVICEFSLTKLTVEIPHQPSTFLITDYTTTLLPRAEMILNQFDSSVYVNGFSRLRRNITPTELPTAEDIQTIYERKQTEKYVNYLGDKYYLGRGLWDYTTDNGNKGEIAVNISSSTLNGYTIDRVNEKPLKYIRKIAELCKDHDVELTFCFLPCSEYHLMRLGIYEQVTGIVKDIARETGTPVLDFNLVKDEYVNYDISDYYNSDHLNTSKCGQITDFLVQYLADPDGDYFYDTLEEKYPFKDYVMFAGYTREIEEDEMNITVSAVSYVDIPVNVKLCSLKKDEEGEYVVKKEYEPEETDRYSASYVLPYDKYKTYYSVDLCDPNTGELLYHAHTRFNME